jgi:hypothetical protein
MKKLFAIIGLLVSVSAGAQDTLQFLDGSQYAVVGCKDTFKRYIIKGEDWTAWKCDNCVIGGDIPSTSIKSIAVSWAKIKPVLLNETQLTHNCAPCYSALVPQTHGQLMSYSDVGTWQAGTPKYDTVKAVFIVSADTSLVPADMAIVTTSPGYVVREKFEYWGGDDEHPEWAVARQKIGYRNPKFLNNSYKPFPKALLIWDYKILEKQ